MGTFADVGKLWTIMLVMGVKYFEKIVYKVKIHMF